MFSISLSRESADHLVVDVLAADRDSVLKQAHELEMIEAAGGELKHYQKQDLLDWHRLAEAMETVLDYYKPIGQEK